MIIIEGMDNTGKTTLGKNLSQCLNTDLIHSIRPKDRKEAEDFSWKLLADSSKLSVRDRCSIIGELVYGKILRGSSLFEESSWLWASELCSTNPIILFCNPPKEVIFNWGEREQMEGVVSHRELIYERYQFVMDKIKKIQSITGGVFIEYDYTSNKCLLTQWGETAEVTTYVPTDIEFISDLYHSHLQNSTVGHVCRDKETTNKVLKLIEEENLKNDHKNMYA